MKNIKITLGLAAAAIGASIATSNVSAIDVDAPISDLPESIYTVVGPNYFTLSGVDIDALYEDNVDVRIENPEIIHFIKSEQSGFPTSREEPFNFMNCTYDYECLQGKKNGETDIVIEEDGEEVKRVHVTSVTLNSNFINYLSSGNNYAFSGSITGADNSILSLDHVYTPSGKVQITKTGERDYSISSIKDIDQGKVAYAVWKVGNEIVGGGTQYNIIRVDAETPELEEITTSLFDTLQNDGMNYGQKLMNGEDLPNLVTLNGALLYVYHPGENYLAFMPGFAGTKYNARLVKADGPKYTESQKKEIEKNLPNGMQAYSFSNVKAQIFFAQSGGGGGGSVEKRSLDPNEADGDVEQLIADVLDFGTSRGAEVSIDVSEAPMLKSGYKRTWYAAVKKADNTYETFEVYYDEATKTVRFKGQVTGDYVIGYIDEIETPLAPDTGAFTKQVATTAVVTIAPLAAIAFIAFAIRNKKKAANSLAKKHNHFE